MLHQLPFFLLLIVSILMLIMLAKRVGIAYPIVLVVAGLLVCFIPGLPRYEISPDLIFVLFLPPLLYEAAWDTSWKELWRFRRIISSFAFLIVLLTSCVVAVVANSFIPGFSLALGFLLGGIVSPPDAVSASAILENVRVSRHFRAIIEGESLLNDASSLIVFRFALIAVGTGQFVFQQAALNFFWVIIAGLLVGLAVAYVFYWLHRLLPTDSNMDIVLTLVAPYAMYIAAESIHVSGVLAVVAGGLFLSDRSHIFLSNQSRIQGYGVWSALGFILNGLVFILIGLQLPVIVNNLGDTSLSQAIGYGVLITVVLMVGRILSAFGAAIFTEFARKYFHLKSPAPGWRVSLIFGWAGMRGVVSLAAALAIPPMLDNGEPFPQRNLILFITFVVILLTLVIQGLTLPWLIRKLHVTNPYMEEQEAESERDIQRRLAHKSLEYLKVKCTLDMQEHPYVKQLAAKWKHAHQLLEDEAMSNNYKMAYFKLLDEQRGWLREWNKELDLDEEIIRKHLMRIDLEEMKMRLA
ncbi:MAG: Na+/H+ antiporter [Saprospiraceae bacterium]|nr:Na+/H+ antiporter [Saprospiraceae bacterium]